MSNKWYKVDNAGKIFPTIWTLKERKSFRLSAVLKEEVDPAILQLALDAALQRFSAFGVRLKRGLFWYYLESNPNKALVSEERNIYCEINPYRGKRHLFSLCYYGHRISLDIFHTLTDGNGGMEFFKCILYYYLQMLGGIFENKGEIMTQDLEKYNDETSDSFLKNYDKNIEKTKKEDKGYKIKGTPYGDGRLGIIQAISSVSEFKNVAKKYNATITEYISACLLQAVYQHGFNGKNQDQVFNLNVPVNVRKFFESNTLRNFALFIRTQSRFNNNASFEDIIEHTKTVFKEQLTKEKLQQRIIQNVKIEKNIFVRILPLFIKKPVMKIGYKVLGSSIDTLCFSNLGMLKLPNGFENYIDRMEFVIPSSSDSPVNASAVSYNDKLTLSFSTFILERKIIKNIIDQFVKDGINILIETNDLEVRDENM